MLAIEDVGRYIALQRKSAGLGQREVAAQAGVSRQTMDLLENGRASEIGYSKLARILAVLGMELELKPASRRRLTLDELRREDDGE